MRCWLTFYDRDNVDFCHVFRSCSFFLAVADLAVELEEAGSRCRSFVTDLTVEGQSDAQLLGGVAEI